MWLRTAQLAVPCSWTLFLRWQLKSRINLEGSSSQKSSLSSSKLGVGFFPLASSLFYFLCEDWYTVGA